MFLNKVGLCTVSFDSLEIHEVFLYWIQLNMSGKGALNLLADYGGDSSDDEVPGCRVSTKRMRKDSDSECDHAHNRNVSR